MPPEPIPLVVPGPRLVASSPGHERAWGRIAFGCAALGLLLGVPLGFPAALAVLTGLGVVLLSVGIWVPSLALIGAGLLSTLDAASRVFLFSTPFLPWNTFNYLLLITAVLFLPLVVRFKDPGTRLLQALIACLSLGLLVSPDLPNGIQHLLPVVAYFGLLVCFRRAAPGGESWYWLALICGTTAAGISAMYYVSSAALPYINANAWSYVPLTGLFAIVLCYPFAAGSRLHQLALAALATLNLVFVFLSASRGGLLIAVCAATTLALTTRGIGTRLSIALVAALLGLGVTAQFSDLQARSVHRLQKLVDPRVSASGRTSGRSELVLAGLHLASRHPLGVGTGGFGVAWSRIDRGEVEGLTGWRRGRVAQAHSGWIKVLAENGVPGFVLLAGFVLSFARTGLRWHRPAYRWLGLVTCLALVVALMSTEFQSKGLWFLAAGATAVLYPFGVAPRPLR